MESFCVAVTVSAATSKGTLREYSVVDALKAGDSSASATLSAFKVASEEPDLLIVVDPDEPDEPEELEPDEPDVPVEPEEAADMVLETEVLPGFPVPSETINEFALTVNVVPADNELLTTKVIVKTVTEPDTRLALSSGTQINLPFEE